MGRQPKQGLDYFPFDVTLPDDPKLCSARQKFGYAAQMVYICLLCILYKDKGYYIPYKGRHRNEVAWQIENMLHGKYPIKTKTILMVIDELVACGLFSDDLFSRDIITSKRAQEVYYSATVDRKSLNVDFNLWLLSKNDMEKLSSRSPILRTFISRPINEENQPKNQVIQPESTQSKVKESKEKDSIFTLTSTLPTAERLERILGCKLNRGNCSAISKMSAEGVSDEVLIETAKYAAQNAKGDKAAYFMTVLRNRIAKKGNGPAIQSESYGTSDGYSHPAADLDQYEQAWLERVRNYKPDEEETDV